MRHAFALGLIAATLGCSKHHDKAPPPPRPPDVAEAQPVASVPAPVATPAVPPPPAAPSAPSDAERERGFVVDHAKPKVSVIGPEEASMFPSESKWDQMTKTTYQFSLVSPSLAVVVYDLPAKWRSAKPDAVFTAFRDDLLANGDAIFEHDDPATVGTAVGRDVAYTAGNDTADLGIGTARERWFLRDKHLWRIKAVWTSRQPGHETMAVQGAHFVESFAFVE